MYFDDKWGKSQQESRNWKAGLKGPRAEAKIKVEMQKRWKKK